MRASRDSPGKQLFLVDIMVANLARWLRILGYDAVVAEHGAADKRLVQQAASEHRVFLTRDKRLAKHAQVFLLSSDTVEGQLAEVVKAFNLVLRFPEETRCPLCNGELKPTTSAFVEGKMKAKIESKRFWECASCGKCYWEGSHWKRIKKTIEELRNLNKQNRAA